MRKHLEDSVKIPLEKKAGLEKVGYAPNATFYPDDKVYFLDKPRDECIIEGVEFNEAKGRFRYGTFSPETKAHCYASGDRIKLMQRGNVWKSHHSEDLKFKDIQEEAEFYEMLGHYKEIEHPLRVNTCQPFLWYKDEALESIKVGIADCLMFDRFQKPYVIKFDDREVGERIRKGIIKNFDLENSPPQPGLLEHIPIPKNEREEFERMSKGDERIPTKQFLKWLGKKIISDTKSYFLEKTK